jgi:hypothetical protein
VSGARTSASDGAAKDLQPPAPSASLRICLTRRLPRRHFPRLSALRPRYWPCYRVRRGR